MEFRARNYRDVESAAALPRSPAPDHPLTRPTPPAPPSTQERVTSPQWVEYDVPLRAHTENVVESDGQKFTSTSRRRLSNEAGCFSTKEWAVFSASLLQRFNSNSKIPISPSLDIVNSDKKDYGKSLADVHIEELEDPEMVSKEEKKIVTGQEYSSQLQELKAEICQSWGTDDHVKALKLSIKVARLLMDTTVSQFYPTLFVLVTEVLDMLGDLVWERIKRKAEYSDDDIRLHSLAETFMSGDVCSEAKETCYNWFCKIGSIRELLPRIYLELAILRCWRFLEDDHLSNLNRLTMMMRGLADPLASAYCHLYMAHCAESHNPRNRGYLITSISDLTFLLERMTAVKEVMSTHSYNSKKMLISLIEPAIEWIMKCLFVDGFDKPGDMLAELGCYMPLSESTCKKPCISLVLHYLLKQIPAEFVSINALDFVEAFEEKNDLSLDQHLNYRLLGLKLLDSPPPVSYMEAVLNKLTKVLQRYNCLEYLMVVDAYIDIILEYSMDYYLSAVLAGSYKQALNRRFNDSEAEVLRSILVKIINHFNVLEDVFSLDHFMGLLELLHGSQRIMVDMQLLMKARTVSISDPTTIQFLFEICQGLHDSIDVLDMDGDQQKAHLISSFVQMVDYGTEREQHLSFLIECRSAFARIDGLKDNLVHMSNNLALKSVKSMKKFMNFLKSCLAFNEVTIPSIPSYVRQMNLYLETAEVSLIGGLVSHTEGLLKSAIMCLQNLNMTAGPKISIEMNLVASLSCKLCSLLVMVPGICEDEYNPLPRNLLSIVECQSVASSWFRTKILCALISLSASLSQKELPYRASSSETITNDQLFFGDTSCHEELLSLSGMALQRLVNIIKEEPNPVIRGKLALEGCNLLLISFQTSQPVLLKCTQLLDIAKTCLDTEDKYLASTMSFFDKHAANL